MASGWTRLAHGAAAGAAAGAAGTTALNAATYLDMAVRGRPASSTPEKTVERLSGLVHVPVPGAGEQRKNRLSGLGALGGIITGVAVGTAIGAVRAAGVRPSPGLTAAGVIGVAMVGANGPMALLGITDPRRWSATEWLSDLLPHLAFGAVTTATLHGLDPD